MKITNDKLKEIAEQVRRNFTEHDRKTVVPLFQMIKALQEDIARLEKFRQPEMISGFPKSADKPMRYPIYKFPEPERNAVNFKDHIKDLAHKGMTDKLELIAKVKGITVDELLRSANEGT